MISILHPSRGRPEKSLETINKWLKLASNPINIRVVVSVDMDDPKLLQYMEYYPKDIICVDHNRSAVDAINNAAKYAMASESANVMIVVSDDTDCFPDWDAAILKEIADKKDFILKTRDDIQPYIITMPILDRGYYQRFGYVYDPDYRHMFVDSWLTIQADITGRKLASNLTFKHLNDSIKDDVRKRSDATWDEGQRTFIQKLKQTPVEDLRKITDQSMKNWIRTHAGIRL